MDAFKLWCWQRLLRVPWTARRSNQSILKEISPEFSLEGLMLKLKLQYFGKRCEELPHLKRPWCWERLKSGGKGDNKGREGWMAPLTWWTWIWANFGSWWWTGKPAMLQSMGSQRVGQDWVTELNWTECSIWVRKALSVDESIRWKCSWGIFGWWACHHQNSMINLSIIKVGQPDVVCFLLWYNMKHSALPLKDTFTKKIKQASIKTSRANFWLNVLH